MRKLLILPLLCLAACSGPTEPNVTNWPGPEWPTGLVKPERTEWAGTGRFPASQKVLGTISYMHIANLASELDRAYAGLDGLSIVDDEALSFPSGGLCFYSVTLASGGTITDKLTIEPAQDGAWICAGHSEPTPTSGLFAVGHLTDFVHGFIIWVAAFDTPGGTAIEVVYCPGDCTRAKVLLWETVDPPAAVIAPLPL